MPTRTIEQRFEIRAPPSRVFRALIRPAELNQWFTDRAEVEPRRGGRYRFAWDGGYVHAGTILSFARPRRLTLAWPQDGRPTELTFRLSRSRVGTVLTLKQEGVGFDMKRFRIFVGIHSGWIYYLTNLRAWLESGTDLRRPRDKYW